MNLHITWHTVHLCLSDCICSRFQTCMNCHSKTIKCTFTIKTLCPPRLRNYLSETDTTIHTILGRGPYASLVANHFTVPSMHHWSQTISQTATHQALIALPCLACTDQLVCNLIGTHLNHNTAVCWLGAPTVVAQVSPNTFKPAYVCWNHIYSKAIYMYISKNKRMLPPRDRRRFAWRPSWQLRPGPATTFRLGLLWVTSFPLWVPCQPKNGWPPEPGNGGVTLRHAYILLLTVYKSNRISPPLSYVRFFHPNRALYYFPIIVLIMLLWGTLSGE